MWDYIYTYLKRILDNISISILYQTKGSFGDMLSTKHTLLYLIIGKPQGNGSRRIYTHQARKTSPLFTSEKTYIGLWTFLRLLEAVRSIHSNLLLHHLLCRSMCDARHVVRIVLTRVLKNACWDVQSKTIERLDKIASSKKPKSFQPK